VVEPTLTLPTGHKHGGNPWDDMQRLGVSPRDVLDFSVNVNPLGLPRRVQEAWPDLIRAAMQYPDSNSAGVISYYTRRFDLPPDAVLPGNGSIDLIYLAPRALGLTSAAVLSPSFHDYERALALAGAAVTRIPLLAKNSFSLPDTDRLSEILDQTDALVISNPNNPTGTTARAASLLSLADAHPGKYLLVDEAFVQFLDLPGRATLLTPDAIRPNILVYHSLTKIFAVPGLRVGSVVGHPETLERLRYHAVPWSVNRVADEVASILGDCGDDEKKVRELVAAEQVRIAYQLADCRKIDLFPSSANFFLARWQRQHALDLLIKGLLEEGIYVRDCRNFPGLESGYFRFCIRRPHENDRLIAALRSVAHE
jgi:threonine-phosphate decarboxylase